MIEKVAEELFLFGDRALAIDILFERRLEWLKGLLKRTYL